MHLTCLKIKSDHEHQVKIEINIKIMECFVRFEQNKRNILPYLTRFYPFVQLLATGPKCTQQSALYYS